MNKTPEQIIQHMVINSVTYEIDDDTGALRVRGSASIGRLIVNALEHAGYQLVSQPGPRGVETR